ncbi:hypothetical protein [Hymenobacter terrenus]|uniref:hypothetical protein n=1 Tax=Hymenobacter terrenus TaxID=1629124 RepID=UPI000619F7A0|nr:hypothetical protein [Hymenobacter terrenus]
MKPHFTRWGALKRLTWIAPLLALLLWANWQPLPLSESYNLAPTSFAAFALPQNISAADSSRLSQTLTQLGGISAVTINRPNKLVGIAYRQTNSLTLVRACIRKMYGQAKAQNFSTYHGPVCPVPQSYVHGIYRVKKWFCFR